MKNKFKVVAISVFALSLLGLHVSLKENDSISNLKAIDPYPDFDTILTQQLLNNSYELASGSYYLDKDLNFSDVITVPNGNTVLVDLKGYKLANTLNGPVFRVKQGGTLKLYDSGNNFRYFNNDDNGFAEADELTGEYCVLGGYLYCTNYYGHLIENEGTCELNDISIIGMRNDSNLIINGSYGSNYGYLTMNYCEIIGNRCQSIINNFGQAFINNTRFTNNDQNCYVVSSYGETTFNECYFSENTASMSMINVYENKTIIKDTTIVNNVTTHQNLGVVNVEPSGTLVLGGSPQIYSNKGLGTSGYGEYVTRNVAVESDSIEIECIDGTPTLDEFSMIGVSLADSVEGFRYLIEGEIGIGKADKNYSRCFICDDDEAVVLGIKDEQTNYYHYYLVERVANQPTEDFPLFSLNLDDSMSPTYKWYKAKLNDNITYFDSTTNPQNKIVEDVDGRKFVFEASDDVYYIKFDADECEKITFTINTSNIANFKYDIYKKGDYFNPVYEEEIENPEMGEQITLKLPENNTYTLRVKAFNENNSLIDFELKEVGLYEQVADYDNEVVGENTNTFSSMDSCGGYYVCEADIDGQIFTSNVMYIKNKIITQPTKDDLSVKVAEEDGVNYKWYYLSYEEEQEFYVNSGVDGYYANMVFCSNNVFSVKDGSMISFTVKKDDKITIEYFDESGISKDRYQNMSISYYVANNYCGSIDLVDGDGDLDFNIISKTESINIFFGSSLKDGHQGEDSSFYIKIKVERGGYSVDLELYNEKTNTLTGNYTSGSYVCFVVFEDKRSEYSNIVDICKSTIASQPTEDNPTFDVVGDNFTYSWYLNDNVLANETSKTLSSESLSLIGRFYCKASAGDLVLTSSSFTVDPKITSQPTKDNPTVLVNAPSSAQITYTWYQCYNNYGSWDDYRTLENENTSTLQGDYPYGTYYCVVSMFDESFGSKYAFSEKVVMGESPVISCPTLEDPTIVLKDDIREDYELYWYQYKKLTFNQHLITDEDAKNNHGGVEIDDWCKAEYIENGLWKLDQSHFYEENIYNEYSLLYLDLEKGQTIKVEVTTTNSCFISGLFTDFGELEEYYYSEAFVKTYTFEMTALDDIDDMYINVQAHNEDKSEFYDAFVKVYVSNFNYYGNVLLEEETSLTLSNINERVGSYVANLVVGDYVEYIYLDLCDRVIEQPSSENNYQVKIIKEDIEDEYTYNFYKYSEDLVYINENYEGLEDDYVGEFNGNVFEVADNRIEPYILGFAVKAGDVIKLKLSTKQGSALNYYWYNDNDDYIPGNSYYCIKEHIDYFEVENDGIYYLYGWGYKATSHNRELTDLSVEIQIGKVTLELVEATSNCLDIKGDDADGNYFAKVLYDGNESFRSEVFNYCSHDYEVSYTWNEDYSEVVATAKCSKDGHIISEKGVITSNVTKETSCKEEGVITYEAVFSSDLFTKQVANKNINKAAHSLSSLISGVSPTCSESGSLAHYHCDACNKDFDENNNELETVEVVSSGHNYGNLISKVEPTCNESGSLAHYHCDVCNKDFDENHDELSKVELSALGHNYGKLISEVESTCDKDGTVAHYHCDNCNKDFDENHNELNSIVIKTTGHKLIKIEAKEATVESIGNIEYYICSKCGKIYKDSEGKIEISLNDIVIDRNLVPEEGCKGSVSTSIVSLLSLLEVLSILNRKRKRI